MRKITVFHDGNDTCLKWVMALSWARRQLAMRGVRVRIVRPCLYDTRSVEGAERLKRQLMVGRYDIVFIVSHRNRGFLLLSQEEQFEVLTSLRKRSRMMVFLDDSDSTGTCEFHLLPYVDRYLKRQVLKDKSLYLEPLHGDRIYSDYYYKRFGIESNLAPGTLATPDQLHKIGISWNLGFQTEYFPPRHSKHGSGRDRFVEPGRDRRYVTLTRCTVGEGPAYFQRRLLNEKLANLSDDSITVASPEWTDHRTYMRDMADCVTVLSPFGYGEACYREFEATFSGAAVVKPDMSHMSTFPAWYVEGETYIPLDWDLENLEEVLSWAAADDGRHECARIARKAQDMMRLMTSDEGKELFADHIVEELGL